MVKVIQTKDKQNKKKITAEVADPSEHVKRVPVEVIDIFMH